MRTKLLAIRPSIPPLPLARVRLPLMMMSFWAAIVSCPE